MMHQRTLSTVTGLAVLLSIAACTPQEPEVVFNGPGSSSTEAQGTSSRSQESISTAPSAPSVPSSSPASAPAKVRIAVPFATQAPFANWDEMHEETCEEASLILAKYYMDGKTITEQQMETELQDLVAWETDHGYGWDVTAGELQKIAKEKYGMNLRMVENVTAEKLEQELASGHPMIIPAAGRMLGNPNFTGAGPWYHMLVLIGYDQTHFITNDVGTRKGSGYLYNKDVFVNAIHDWTGVKEETDQGAKRVLVVE